MRFGPFGVRIDCHAPAPEGVWGQIWGSITAVGRPKTPNTVLQTRRAQKRFNLASVRLSKMGKHHSSSYGFCTFSGSSGSTPTVRPQRSWEPLFGPLVSAWHPFCHSKLFENLRRSLPAQAGGANSVHRYRCRLRRDLKNGVSRCGLGRLGWKSAAVHPHRKAFGAKFGTQAPLLAAQKRQTRRFKRDAHKKRCARVSTTSHKQHA